jgi:hypothetical protein
MPATLPPPTRSRWRRGCRRCGPRTPAPRSGAGAGDRLAAEGPIGSIRRTSSTTTTTTPRMTRRRCTAPRARFAPAHRGRPATWDRQRSYSSSSATDIASPLSNTCSLDPHCSTNRCSVSTDLSNACSLLELVDQGASHKALARHRHPDAGGQPQPRDERLRRARVHTHRHLRWGQDEHGGIRGGFFCDEVEFARVAPRLEAEAKRRWRAAGNGPGGGVGDSLEAHRLDAFIDLLSGSDGFGSDGDDADDSDDDDRGGGGGGPDHGLRSGPRPAAPRTLIIVNAESLRRGTTQGDDGCAPSATGSRPTAGGASKDARELGNGSHRPNHRARSRWPGRARLAKAKAFVPERAQADDSGPVPGPEAASSNPRPRKIGIEQVFAFAPHAR